MALMVLAKVGFSQGGLFARAVEGRGHERDHGAGRFHPRSVSALSLVWRDAGTAGLPQHFDAFLHCPDAKRRASRCLGDRLDRLFLPAHLRHRLGAIVLVSTNPAFLDAKARCAVAAHGGDPPREAVGGNLFLGFISAVAFANHTRCRRRAQPLSGASAISHDLYASLAKDADPVQEVSRVEVRDSGPWAGSRSCSHSLRDPEVAFMVSSPSRLPLRAISRC